MTNRTEICKVNDWPEVDQRAWENARLAGKVLKGTRGLAHQWREQTRLTNEKHYGRWLKFLQQHRNFDAQARPESRITPDSVEQFLGYLQAHMAPYSVRSAIVGLTQMARVMAPNEDWGWLQRLCAALRRQSPPGHKSHRNLVPSEKIFSAALMEMRKLADSGLLTQRIKGAYRDTFMMAMIASRPLRLKNFAALTLEQNFVRRGSNWEIRFRGEEVKNGKPIAFDVPAALITYLDIYLDVVRAHFLRRGPSDALWLGLRGGRMVEASIYQQLMVVSHRLVGKSINPHLYRACAATSLAIDSPAAAMLAASLLGDNFATTQRAYIVAQRLEASRRLNAAIGTID